MSPISKSPYSASGGDGDRRTTRSPTSSMHVAPPELVVLLGSCGGALADVRGGCAELLTPQVLRHLRRRRNLSRRILVYIAPMRMGRVIFVAAILASFSSAIFACGPSKKPPPKEPAHT